MSRDTASNGFDDEAAAPPVTAMVHDSMNVVEFAFDDEDDELARS